MIPFLYTVMLALLGSGLASTARADTLSGTVKDSSGGVVAGARVEISGGAAAPLVVVTTDQTGKFSAPNLPAGKYSIKVSKDGFDNFETTVEFSGTADIAISLKIATQQTSVTVTDKSLAYANSDPAYRQLRDIGLGDSYRVENYTMTLDVGRFVFKSGTITLLAPVNNTVIGAIFVGQGHFTLKPPPGIDTAEMTRRSGGPTAEEDFSDVVFRFTGQLYPRVQAAFGAKTETPAEADAVLRHWKDKLRHRNEIPEGFTEAILQGETIDNVDADMLAAVYNPGHPLFINAYMHGAQHKDVRFFIRTRVGALQQLDSPEEVALINMDGGGMNDGVWYSDHLLSEIKAGTANSREDRRLFATKRYNIETVIAKNDHLFSRATITLEPLIAGERVIKFGLLPNLRVTRVTDQNGRDVHFIQENRKGDGSFYAVLDEAPPLGQDHSIIVEYQGDKVLYNAGNGSFYVGARESWYPNVNGFGEKVLYDLTFKVPHADTVISVGKLVGQTTEEGFAVTHWVTPVPVATAGFNIGEYKKMDFPDTITHYEISGYYLTELPDSLKPYEHSAFLASMAPSAMTKYALDQARAQMQVCTLYFGKGPYENVYITEQPNFNFGQSWPNLVYLPISAYIDSTQRWMLFGGIDAKFDGFVQEVTPHEVAHQWFGHAVGWASYHDQWLSEGFAEFAAGLFLQQAMPGNWRKDYLDFWERQRKRILEKNNYGISPNDAGPLWLGLRLISPKSPRAYQGVTYSKGAYVLLMLRSLMWDDAATSGNRDQVFMDMMHDFMDSHRNAPASTESFKAIVEKHLTKQIDIQKGRMDWFFNEWVYGTQVPRYSFKYDMKPAEEGKIKVHAEVTQSEVDEHFVMFVPMFADYGNGMTRIGQAEVIGNSTRTMDFTLDKQPKKIALNAYKDVLER
ncbi:MAG: M1 family aminopeptidase [Candidatus Acidiferrum sp.]